MMHDATTNLSEFLEAVAARSPTPGGGAVSAVAGALAAAIGEMALSYSIGKKDLAAHQHEFEEALAQLRRARDLLLRLMVEDQAAYDALATAKKGTDPLAREAAVLTAIRVPQAIASASASVLEQAHRVAPIANRWLLSDLAVCAELAMTGVRCGCCNVRANLSDVSDDGERVRLRQWCDELNARATETIRKTVPAIWERIER